MKYIQLHKKMIYPYLDQLTFLLELTLVFRMDHSRGKHIRVEPVNKRIIFRILTKDCPF